MYLHDKVAVNSVDKAVNSVDKATGPPLLKCNCCASAGQQGVRPPRIFVRDSVFVFCALRGSSAYRRWRAAGLTGGDNVPSDDTAA